MASYTPNLGNLVLEAAYLLGDPSGARFGQGISGSSISPTLSSNPLQVYLNEAAEMMNLQAGLYRSTISISVTTSAIVAVKDSPAQGLTGRPPYGRILRLEDQNGVALVEAMEAAQDPLFGATWKQDTTAGSPPGQPTRWFRGIDSFGSIRLWPTPNFISSVNFSAYVVAPPIQMLASTDLPWIGNDTNTEACPVQHARALPFYAAWKCLLWNQDSADLQLAQLYRAEFDKAAQQAQSEVAAALKV